MQQHEEEKSNKEVYRVQGFTCTNCAGKFESNVKNLPGVTDAQVNFGAAKITVMGNATVEELEKAGAFENLKITPEKQRIVEKKEPFWKENWNVLLSLLLMAAGYYLASYYGEEALVPALAFGAAIIIGGYELFKKGIKNLFQLQFDMNTLMTVAIIGAAAIGEWGEGAVVVLLFAISEALERYSMQKARQSIRSLMDIAPKEALIRRGSAEMTISVDDIQVGDVMIVKPGQKLAMDGVVIKGTSTLNQAAITGESVPVAKTVDDEVFAGTLNEEGLLEVRVTKHVEDTTISKIIHLVEEAQAERAPSQAFVDRFAKYYTPVIMVMALGIATIPPLLGGDWGDWIYSGLSLLVVGCPCALVISTPISIVTAIGNAARNGVLIKGGIHLEEAGRISAVAFDKTGTLTKGFPEVTDITVFGEHSEVEMLSIAAVIEKGSQHPLASAIVRKAEQMGADLSISVDHFQSITGKGAKASVGQQQYYIGSPKLFDELEADVSGTIREQIVKLQMQGKTVMVLGTHQEVIALVAVADAVRDSSKAVISELHSIGVKKTIMLTGDNQATANAIGQQLGVAEIKAELLPQDKLDYIKQLRGEYSHVAMVGDGVNDAPALAASTVGIAMGGAGTDTALETADIALMADDLRKLPYTIRLSKKTLAIIKQNVGFSLGIKLLALILIVPGWLTLWLAILADMGATLIVTLNSLRLLKIQKEK
ncbi:MULTISPECIES: heavy metal translocating P-type ATPase [Paenibacillus]|uniref:Cd(2+)-exporting ATPase n=1 Tax=Paenibacillus illinoisensis TaxID=59845 RepID=A0A2W0CFP7_9BACL|nr:heavy metal translocating P-type ATPase [Paenibacillus illinoisensis]PYY27165.1 Cadmium-exporting ATPase [Paenibacillus illinoisensis]